MKIRLHFGVLAIFLAFVATYLEQRTVPNQQIVIRFSDKDIAIKDAENTIAIVKKQLQSVGIQHIQISHNGGGELKITYYSDSDIERIQNVLSQEDRLKFAYESGKGSTDFPENKNVKDYELNISEIQNSNNSNWNFEKTEIAEFNPKSDQSHYPKVNTSFNYFDNEQIECVIFVALKANSAIEVAIDNRSYKTPEVRAGPQTYGII